MADPTDSDIKTMSFEQALKELETIVDRLEKGDVELEASIRIYERGEALKTHCDALLRKAEAQGREDLAQSERPAHRHRAARRRRLEPIHPSIVTLSFSPYFGLSVMRANGVGRSPSGSAKLAC